MRREAVSREKVNGEIQVQRYFGLLRIARRDREGRVFKGKIQELAARTKAR